MLIPLVKAPFVAVVVSRDARPIEIRRGSALGNVWSQSPAAVKIVAKTPTVQRLASVAPQAPNAFAPRRLGHSASHALPAVHDKAGQQVPSNSVSSAGKPNNASEKSNGHLRMMPLVNQKGVPDWLTVKAAKKTARQVLLADRARPDLKNGCRSKNKVMFTNKVASSLINQRSAVPKVHRGEARRLSFQARLELSNLRFVDNDAPVSPPSDEEVENEVALLDDGTFGADYLNWYESWRFSASDAANASESVVASTDHPRSSWNSYDAGYVLWFRHNCMGPTV